MKNLKNNFIAPTWVGSAMGLHYVLKETPTGIDALSPDNVLALCTGVVTGTPISGQSRLTSVAKSPLTE